MELSNEAALVLCCTRTNTDPSTQDEVERLISTGVDWHRVLSLVRSNGVLPVFRANILRYCPDNIPGSVRAQMGTEFQFGAATSIGYARELTRVSACLQQHGVRAIAFKGPAVAQQLYGKLSLRQCQDLDILVDRSEFQRAVDAVCSAGYTAVYPASQGSKTIFQADKHILLIAETRGFRVEIHWSLSLPSDYFRLRFDELWRRREHISVLGSSIPVPSKEDLLLILCFHAATHYWGSLKWICDIAELLKQHPDLEWPVVLARARKLGCRRILFIGLTLARDTNGLRLPEALDRQATREKTVEKIRDIVVLRFSAGACPCLSVEKPLMYICSRERLRDKVRLAADFVGQRIRPNERDREWVRLPDALRFLYILVRITRVACLRYDVSLIPLLRSILS